MNVPSRALSGLDSQPAAVLVALTAVGLGLRCFDLGAKSFWLDELLSLNHARQITGWTSFVAPNAGDAHPPLYFVLLKGWLLLTGGDAWARWPSVVLGAAVIPATYLLAGEFFSTRVSLLSALLVAVAPLLLLYDREVRNYPQFTLLSVLSLGCFFRALRHGRRADWAAYMVLTVLSIYTHYHALLLVAGELAYFALRLRVYRTRLSALLLSLVIVALTYLPMLPTLLMHASSVGALEATGGRFPVLLGYWCRPAYLGFAFAVGQTLLPWTPLAVAGGLAVAVLLISGVRRLRRQPDAAAFLVSCLALPIAIGTVLSDSMPRYYLFVAPLFYMVVAAGAAAVSRPLLRKTVGAVLAVSWGVAIANYYMNREFHVLAHVDPWRDVGQLLKVGVADDDVLVQVALQMPLPANPLEYASGLSMAVRGEDILTDLPRLTRDGTAPRVWLVVSESTMQQSGLAAAAWLSQRYAQCTEYRYVHDPAYLLKKRFFRKDFAEYRIRVYRFAGPATHVGEEATCTPMLVE